MSISTVDLKCAKAFQRWEQHRLKVLADPSGAFLMPRVHGDTVTVDAFVDAFLASFVFRRKGQRAYIKALYRQVALRWVQIPGRREHLCSFSLPTDALNVGAFLLRNEGSDLFGGTSLRESHETRSESGEADRLTTDYNGHSGRDN